MGRGFHAGSKSFGDIEDAFRAELIFAVIRMCLKESNNHYDQ